MSADWEERCWGDLATLEYGKALRFYEVGETAYPVYGTNGRIGFHQKPLWNRAGVIVGRKGAYRGIHYSATPFFVIDTAFYLKPKQADFDLRWAYYQLKDFDINKIDSGSAIPSTSREAFYAIPVIVPSLPTQRKIAAVLSAYDDLIENNTRRIQILEEMARALYREWFVEFRFPGHEGVEMVETEHGRVPRGWRNASLFDVANVTYGFPFKSALFGTDSMAYPVIRIRDIKGNRTQTFTIEQAVSKYVVENGDILIGMDGDFHMGKWAGGTAYLNQRVVRFRPKDGTSKYALFLGLQSPIAHLQNTIVGTTVAHLSDRDLRAIKILVPDEQTREAMVIFNDLYDLENSLRVKNANLRRTRDLLLPKLVSGEVDVSGLEIETGVASM